MTLQDRFGRTIDYLRISLTDRCQLRCVYCLPSVGMAWYPGEDLLSDEEIERIVRAAVGLGFRKVRLSGGEPTLRPSLVELVQRLASIEGLLDLGMTTNGLRLADLAFDLRRAGLRRVNIHLDAVDGHRLSQTMIGNQMEKVWAGIEAAEQGGLSPVKINCVVVRGYNESEVVDLAALTLQREWEVRFIELMPLGPCAELALTRHVPSAETRARIEAALGPLDKVEDEEGGEAERYQLFGARGRVGFISPVSRPYCSSCRRLRLSADGFLLPCLLSDQEIDLKPALRRGEGELQDLFRQAIGQKPMGHRLRERRYPRKRAMAQIGG